MGWSGVGWVGEWLICLALRRYMYGVGVVGLLSCFLTTRTGRRSRFARKEEEEEGGGEEKNANRHVHRDNTETKGIVVGAREVFVGGLTRSFLS